MVDLSNENVDVDQLTETINTVVTRLEDTVN